MIKLGDEMLEKAVMKISELGQELAKWESLYEKYSQEMKYERDLAFIDLMKNKMTIFTLSLISITTFLALMLVLPALPWMIDPLGANQESISLIISVYSLPGIFLLPILGYIIDRIGRKALLLPSLALFSVSGGNNPS